MFTWIVAAVGIILAFLTLGRIKSQKTFSDTITRLENDREEAAEKTEVAKKEYEEAKQEVKVVQKATQTLLFEEEQHEKEYQAAVQTEPEEIADVSSAIQLGNDIVSRRRARRNSGAKVSQPAGSVDDGAGLS